MSNPSDLDDPNALLLQPGTARLLVGAMTWLLLILMPWLAVAVMYSLLVFPLLPVAILSALAYLALTVRSAGQLTVARVAGAVLLVAGLVWTEWAAFVTAGHLATTMVAASRGREVHLGVAGPMASSLIGVLLFFVGMKLMSQERGGTRALWETLAVALICPMVAFLVRFGALPLSA